MTREITATRLCKELRELLLLECVKRRERPSEALRRIVAEYFEAPCLAAKFIDGKPGPPTANPD